MMVILLAGMLFVVLGWEMLYKAWWHKQIAVDISFDLECVYAGEEVRLTEVITNDKKMPVPVLEVAFQMPKGICFQNTENNQVSDYVYRRDIFALLGNQRITRSLCLRCDRRGIYDIRGLSIFAYSMFYGNEYIKKLEGGVEKRQDAKLYVYARRTNVSGIAVLCESLIGELESRKKIYEDPFCFEGIREYQVTDAMKTINWKASSKTGVLMVNTYHSILSGKIMICLDIEDAGIYKQGNLVEDSISVAASLSQKLLMRGYAVGFFMNLQHENEQYVYMQPSKERGRQRAIERLLAEKWKENEVTDYWSGVSAVSFAPDIVPVFISKNASEERKMMLEKLLGYGNKGIWVVPVENGKPAPVSSSACMYIVARGVDI